MQNLNVNPSCWSPPKCSLPFRFLKDLHQKWRPLKNLQLLLLMRLRICTLNHKIIRIYHHQSLHNLSRPPLGCQVHHHRTTTTSHPSKSHHKSPQILQHKWFSRKRVRLTSQEIHQLFHRRNPPPKQILQCFSPQPMPPFLEIIPLILL